jgi:hypothetical protein
MKRIFLTAMASSTLALALPAVASAHHGGRHHGARHASAHKRHAAQARTVTFGAPGAITPASGSSTTPPAAPVAPSTPSSETAGTVASFTNGLLTITLSNGSTVSGQVTDATELECQPATPPATTGGDDEGADDGEHGEPAPSSWQQHDGGQQGEDGGDSQGNEAGDGGGDSVQQTCTVAALVPGAIVREAELSVSGAGSIWDKLALVQ